MYYERIVEAVFLRRPNRFIAHVLYNGNEEIVHVKNTGRCAELLQPGATVYLQESDNPERKTKWDLIAVKKGDRMVNMDSQIPNYVVKEWLEAGNLFENISYCFRISEAFILLLFKHLLLSNNKDLSHYIDG